MRQDKVSGGHTGKPVGSDAQDEDGAQELDDTEEGCHTLQCNTAFGHHDGGASSWVRIVVAGEGEKAGRGSLMTGAKGI